MWCRDSNLILNTFKAKTIKTTLNHFTSMGMVSELLFLRVHIMEDLYWGVNTTEMAKN